MFTSEALDVEEEPVVPPDHISNFQGFTFIKRVDQNKET